MSKRASQILVSLTLLIPVGIFFWVWDYYAINVPKWDDHALKAFLVEYLNAGSFSEKIMTLFQQHNEHRISVTRFVALLDYKVFGELNFKRLMFYGNLTLLSVVALWWVLLKNNLKPLYALIPVPFIWLTLSHYENMYWGMASVQNFGVVALILWTLYCAISRRRELFILSLVLAGMACLTSGNGLLVLPVGAVLLFLAPRWRRLIVWLAVSALYLFVYFYSYQPSPSNPDARFGVGLFLEGFLYFLGSFAESFPVKNHQSVCLFLGGVLLLVAISIASTTLFRIVRNRYDYDFAKITDLFCLGVLMLVLGTSLVVVYTRVGFGLEGLLTSRYKIYSFLLLLVAYLYVVIPIRGSFLSPYVSGIVFFCALYSVFSYHYHLVDAFNLRKFQTTQYFNANYPDRTLVLYQDTTLAGRLAEQPAVFYQKWLPLIQVASRQSFAGQTAGLQGLAQNTSVTTTAEGFTVSNPTYQSQRLQDSGVYFVLSSAKRYYLFPALRQRNANRRELFLDQAYFAPGFRSEIPFWEVEPGRYAFGIVVQQGDRVGIMMQGDSLLSKKVVTNKVKTNW